MKSFYEFLIKAAEQSCVSSEPWRDIGLALAVDPQAPKTDTLLYKYLKMRMYYEDLVDDAWIEYLKVRV